MSNWEDELMIPEETTPIYDALAKEHHDRIQEERWERIQAGLKAKREADALKACTGATSVTVIHERRNADGTLEVTSTEESS